MCAIISTTKGKELTIMKTLLKAILCIYLCISCLWSVWYNTSDNAWDIATMRNGLLLVSVEDDSLAILSPFTNYADVYLWGWGIDEQGYSYTFSDGLDSFGMYNLHRAEAHAQAQESK